jgi:hypothetical protein
MAALHRIKPGGVAEYFEPLGVTTAPTSTCAHCQHLTEFPSMRVMHQHVDVCRGCMKLICLGCAGKPCRPWEKELDRQEAEARLAAKIEASRWRD